MQLENHEDAVNLVKGVFKSMGGRVIPPRRPRHMDKYAILTLDRDDFMMDFENSCLSQHWNSNAHPKGSKRYEDPEWAAMIQTQVYPNHSDVDWNEYVDWVSRGFGAEWFQESPQTPPISRKVPCSRTPSPPQLTRNLNGYTTGNPQAAGDLR